MRNKVTKIFSDMTDEELVLVIDEMREDEAIVSFGMRPFYCDSDVFHSGKGQAADEDYLIPQRRSQFNN